MMARLKRDEETPAPTQADPAPEPVAWTPKERDKQIVVPPDFHEMFAEVCDKRRVSMREMVVKLCSPWVLEHYGEIITDKKSAMEKLRKIAGGK